MRLSGNCLDGLLMRGIVRWMELHALAELRKWAGIGNQICPTGASTVPMMGKHVAPGGQAPCPILIQIGH
ncbi:hypothetical protein ST42_06375 [Prevotella pectinovora]|nr:hypothetical protein ST42_06375 [Prevotella pectinovora]